MAVFNPGVPDTQDPNYLNYFKPISDIPADKSTGTLLAGLGNSLETGVNATDQAIKRGIDKDVYASVDPIRDEFTSALEAVRAGQSAAAVPTNDPTAAKGVPDTATWNSNTYGYQPKSAGAALSLLPENTPANVPTALQNGLDKVAAIGEAGNQNAGKINDTYYTQRLTSAVKQLRAQYPGYREYIDSKVSETTGIVPANAYIRNMMEDINKQQTNALAEKNKIGSYLISNLEVSPQMPMLYQAWKQGIIPDEKIMEFVNTSNAKMYQFKVAQAERENYKGNKEVDASMAKEHFTAETSFAVSNALKSYQITAGLDTAESAATFLSKVQSGELKASPQQIEQLKTAFAGAKNTVYQQMYKRSIDPDKTGQSYVTRMGPQSRDDIINSSLKPYDMFQDSMTNEKYGLGTYVPRMAEAYQNQATLNILEDKTIGRQVAVLGSLSKQLGPQVLATMTDSLLKGDFDKKTQAFIAEKLTQSWEAPDIRAARGDAPRSLKADVEDAANKGFAGKSGVYDKFLSNIDNLTTKARPVDDVTKEAIVEYMFDPRNTGVINSFNMEYRDPKSGQVIPGKLAAFSILTQPDVTKEVWRLSNKKPELWNNYQRITEQSFASIYGEKLRDLNTIQSKAGINMHVAWDTDNKQFELLGPKGERLTQQSISQINWANSKNLNNIAVDGYVRSALENVRQINQGLTTLSGVQDVKGTPTTTQAYLIRVLDDNGYAPRGDTKGLTDNPQSLPANMWRALEQGEEDAINKLRPKNPEDLDMMKRRSTIKTSVGAG